MVNGHLEIGELAAATRSSSPVLCDARFAAPHPEVHWIAEDYVRSGHLGPAIFEVVKTVNLRVKALAGKEQEPDNANLMGLVFTAKAALLQLADLSTPTGRDIQDG